MFCSTTKILLLCIILSSCGNFVTRKQIDKDTRKVKKTKEIPVVTLLTNDELEILETDNVSSQQSSNIKSREVSSLSKRQILSIDYEDHHFDLWVNYFSKKGKERFERQMGNGAKYRNIISEILEANGLPTDLFFVGLIESGYHMTIKSSASAVGPWQFIKGTADRYGLRVDSQVDERTHIIKSTQAAAGYFRDLYNIFGSWELALCAYNAGEYRIINAIRKGNTRDYRELVRKKLIPKETILYVPKVAAARALYESPKKYGMKIPKNINGIFEKAKIAKVGHSFDLYNVAKENNVSLSLLKDLNPDLKQRWIKVNKRRPQAIYIPANEHITFTKHDQDNEEVVRIASINKTKKVYHVKRGDNLSVIAKRLGVDVASLKRINNIRSSKIYVGQKLKIATPQTVAKKVIDKEESSTEKLSAYIVRAGDNLTVIAEQFNTTINELKSINSLRSLNVYIGQKLLVPALSVERYLVQRGDSLYQISKKFGVTISQIKRINNLASNDVFRGQVLKIPQDEG